MQEIYFAYAFKVVFVRTDDTHRFLVLPKWASFISKT